MSNELNHQWILKKRPQGLLSEGDLEFRETPLPALEEGQCLIRILYIAMDPATRTWISESGGYLDPLPLGTPVMGVTIGRVEASKNPEIPEGMMVAGVGQWARYMIVGPDQITPTQTGALGALAPIDTSAGLEPPMYLHALGTSGATAYYGLVEVAGLARGDRVLVSGAAGSVGSLVSQIAKLKGAGKVVGIAGGNHKCGEAVRDYACDSCIDYKAESDLSAAIGREFPEGFDVYFDNVGGDVLEAAMDHMAKGARVAVCGMISQYNDAEGPPGPKNMWNLVANTARIEGFLVSDYFGKPECERAYGEIAQWLGEGKLNAKLDIREDFEHIPDVFNQLFTGGNDGRLVVKVPE